MALEVPLKKSKLGNKKAFHFWDHLFGINKHQHFIYS